MFLSFFTFYTISWDRTWATAASAVDRFEIDTFGPKKSIFKKWKQILDFNIILTVSLGILAV